MAHELAHIQRYDYLINLLQTFIETILFYHPAIWWLSRRIRLERELCCDDIVIDICQDRISYVEALSKVAKLHESQDMAMTATGSNLMHRIRRIAMPSNHKEARLTKAILSILIVFTATASMFGPNLKELFAQDTDLSVPPDARTITFPDWTMGQLMIRSWGSSWRDEWEPYQSAMGTVSIPAGTEVQLIIDNNAATDLSPLGYLEAQDIQSINFRRSGGVKSRVELILA